MKTMMITALLKTQTKKILTSKTKNINQDKVMFTFGLIYYLLVTFGDSEPLSLPLVFSQGRLSALLVELLVEFVSFSYKKRKEISSQSESP